MMKVSLKMIIVLEVSYEYDKRLSRYTCVKTTQDIDQLFTLDDLIWTISWGRFWQILIWSRARVEWLPQYVRDQIQTMFGLYDNWNNNGLIQQDRWTRN
jgi:hypothetical protein